MSNRIGITGERSAITKEFIKLIGDSEVQYGTTTTLPRDLDQYLLCAGVLVGKNAVSITDEEAIETFKVNFLDVIRFCDEVLAVNKKARICVIGSESGRKGSFDMVYAGSKAATHLYVQTKKLEHPEQHLVCVSPTIIEDSGMTTRRADFDKVIERGKDRKLGRWVLAEEVARTAHFALGELSLCNVVIPLA